MQIKSVNHTFNWSSSTWGNCTHYSHVAVVCSHQLQTSEVGEVIL